MENSKIAWTTNTFNPWHGCTRVSEGCKFCYAESVDARYHPGNEHWGPSVPRKTMSEHYWNDPLRWERKYLKEGGERPLVFCASMADVFDVEAPEGQRDRLYDLIRKTPNLIWLLLTKRPENAAAMLPPDWGDGYPNVWLGTTTEDQENYDKRAPILRGLRAKTKFLSVEPQIGEIEFGWMSDWLIFGGESEKPSKARPFDPEWVRKPMAAAKKAGVATFVKQMGSQWAKANGVDGKSDEPSEWPEWLRVREFPSARYEKLA